MTDLALEPIAVAATAHLDAETLYRILALRSEVFVVEQQCAYPELDGRDLEPATRHLWIVCDAAVVATLRLLSEGDGTARIGRVATARSQRGHGLAARLTTRAIELAAGRAVVLDAQAHLQNWYARFGFSVIGAQYLDDGIAHVPMRRPADPSTQPIDTQPTEALAELIETQRRTQDLIAGAAPSDATGELIRRLRAVNILLAAHQLDEQHHRLDGTRLELPGRGEPLLPPYELDEVTTTNLRGRVRFGRFHLGGGGAAHGGSLALLFDDIMGQLVRRGGGPCRTAYLHVRYLRITPLHIELSLDTSIDRVEGRKNFLTARLRNPSGEVVAECDALFVRLRPGQQ